MSEKLSVLRSSGPTRGPPTWSVRSRKEWEANNLRWSLLVKGIEVSFLSTQHETRRLVLPTVKSSNIKAPYCGS